MKSVFLKNNSFTLFKKNYISNNSIESSFIFIRIKQRYAFYINKDCKPRCACSYGKIKRYFANILSNVS